MIVIYHNNRCITRIVANNEVVIAFDNKKSIANELMQIATQFPDSKLVWCHENVATEINFDALSEVFHHNKIMLSYHPKATYLGREIGYVEVSPFVNVNKKVSYPTWQMSSTIGIIHASVLFLFKDKIKLNPDFDYFLNAVAKIGQPFGLLCYSEPRLLKKHSVVVTLSATIFTLFTFVKEHYKTRWLFLLLLHLMIYEKRFPFFAFVNALFLKKRNPSFITLETIAVQSQRSVIDKGTMDVIIPTIGRKLFLYDVLKDLALQTHLPKNVIIVEQNPLAESLSELDYLQNESWPFTIKHTFTHQAGACNARNLALKQVESEWVFLNDDDNRFDANLIEKTFDNIKKYGEKSVTTSYLQRNEKKNYLTINQSGIFGSGNSFVKTEMLNQVSFDGALEFGYGEDTDFGLQLRNLGVDVIYFPNPEILHLKAPMGGFRTKPKLQWQNEPIQPKPSPTIMYVKQKYDTKEQILGYKTILFFKFYKLQSIKSPFQYYKNFQKQWRASVFWANVLKVQNEK